MLKNNATTDLVFEVIQYKMSCRHFRKIRTVEELQECDKAKRRLRRESIRSSPTLVEVMMQEEVGWRGKKTRLA